MTVEWEGIVENFVLILAVIAEGRLFLSVAVGGEFQCQA